MGSTWTVGETDTLIGLWPTASAAQIAKRLQRPRDAIYAKAGRLRREGVLPATGPGKHFEISPRTPRRPARPKPILDGATSLPRPPLVATNVGREVRAPPLEMRPCSILELDRTKCRWPLGDIEKVAVQYCGGGTVPGRRYCAHHLQRASKGSAS